MKLYNVTVYNSKEFKIDNSFKTLSLAIDRIKQLMIESGYYGGTRIPRTIGLYISNIDDSIGGILR